MQPKKWLSCDDLIKRGTVPNWQTLLNWQRDPKVNFPKGKWLGPNTHRWDAEEEIEPWEKSRPAEMPDRPRRYRPRKAKVTEAA